MVEPRLIGIAASKVEGQTVVMVTHEARAASIADRVLFLADGNIVRELSGAQTAEIGATMEEISSQ